VLQCDDYSLDCECDNQHPLLVQATNALRHNFFRVPLKPALVVLRPLLCIIQILPTSSGKNRVLVAKNRVEFDLTTVITMAAVVTPSEPINNTDTMNEKLDPVPHPQATAPPTSETVTTTDTPTATTTTVNENSNPIANEPAAKAPEIPLVKVATAIVNEEEKTGKKLVPFLAPLPTCKPAPVAELTPDQSSKYDALLAHVSAIKMLPISTEKGAEERELDEAERMWLTRECLLRYLRAVKWDLAAATKRIETTIVWRREYGVANHTADYISPENETGKQVILGYDNEGRPCLYLNPGRQNTERSPRQVQHLVFMLERIVDLMPAGQETLALLIDFGASTKSSNPSIAQSREVLNILQSHYPERLGRALCINRTSFPTRVAMSANDFSQFPGLCGVSLSSLIHSLILL